MTAVYDDTRANDIIKAKFETYEEVANYGQKTLSTRWVITTKDGNSKLD